MPNWLKRLFGPSDYLSGHAQASDALARLTFERELGFTSVECFDQNYVALPEEQLRAFVFKYHDNTLLAYHGQSDEFPDCDDFAAVAYSGMIRGAIKERFKYPVLFGEVTLQHKGQGWHRQNWAVTAGARLMLFEPQTGQWQADLGSVESIREACV